MQNEIRKKKKAESHKVTLLAKKLQGCSFEVKESQNAFFPYEPYPEQALLIKKVHESIMNKENALIESPTGTGKTLCMLVGSLSCLTSLSSTPNMKVPKVFYLTRTHSQITQVINQLKRIPWYQCKINVIASREHLCINRNLKELKGRLLDRGCQEMCKQKLCKFKEETSQGVMPFKQWLTLEELCEKGNKQGFCPFYFSKMATEKCELTIMPFNYLLDWNLLQNNNFNLKNSVIIFDEAHNVDSLAEEGSSLEIDTEMLSQCLLEIKNLEQSSKCRYLHKRFETSNDSSDQIYIGQAKSLIARMNFCLKESQQQRNCNHIEDMLKMIKKMTNFVANDEQFKGADLNNYEDILFNLEKVKKLFGQKKIQGEQFEIFYSTFSKIMRVLDSNSSNIQDYYLYAGPKSPKGFTLKLNCLNASFTFQRIAQQKPRSIILCSGTLGSFEIWQKELEIQFQTKLKIPSFITPRQVKVGIVEHSLNKQLRYQFSYQHKNKYGQFEAFVNQLKEIEKIVPNGIVVAFSTYELMQKCMNQSSGLKKPVFFQSKNQNVDRVYLKYSQAAKSEKGAYLFIVMKGKFSEGINFNDELCRCLIVVGIPFLPPNDYKIVRKKSYLQNKFGREAAEQWYYAQTFKSVNQVMGRAIRSKQDYACILLFDQRYGRKDILTQLPSWFLTNLRQNRNGRYLDDVEQFFRDKPWLSSQDCKVEKPKVDSSFNLALQLAHETKVGSLQKLLEHQTPVKIKKMRPKVLKIDSDEQTPEESETKKAKLHTKSIQRDPIEDQQTKKHPVIEKSPWLSLDYFIGEQIQSYIKESKSKMKQKMDPIEPATLTFHKNKKRNYKYL